MRCFSCQRIDFYSRDARAIQNTYKDGMYCVVPFALEKMKDIESFRGTSVAQQFKRYLIEGERGYVLYPASNRSRACGHAWVWEAGFRRKLFDFLPIPDDEDFIFFCNVDNRMPQPMDGFCALLSTCAQAAQTDMVGISVPRCDMFLREAIRLVGFYYCMTMLRISLFRFTIALPWFASNTLNQDGK